MNLFADIWNSSESVEEVAKVAGCSKAAASKRAWKLRNEGQELKYMPQPMRTFEERFFDKVHKTSSCWIWTGSKNRKGYGQMSFGRRGTKPVQAHRASWCIHFVYLPKGLWVLHRCDNPSCVNPRHLFLGTAQDNTDDMFRKGRASWQK